MQTTINRREPSKPMPLEWVPWINVAIGVAVIITPFVVAADRGTQLSDVITGIVIVIVALISFGVSRTLSGSNISIINVIAGVWLLVSTSFSENPTITWLHVVYGVLAALTAIIVLGEHKAHVDLTRS
jgi:hypothetical protein